MRFYFRDLKYLGHFKQNGVYILFEGVQHKELFQNFGLTSFSNFTGEKHFVYYSIHLEINNEVINYDYCCTTNSID